MHDEAALSEVSGVGKRLLEPVRGLATPSWSHFENKISLGLDSEGTVERDSVDRITDASVPLHVNTTLVCSTLVIRVVDLALLFWFGTRLVKPGTRPVR